MIFYDRERLLLNSNSRFKEQTQMYFLNRTKQYSDSWQSGFKDKCNLFKIYKRSQVTNFWWALFLNSVSFQLDLGIRQILFPLGFQLQNVFSFNINIIISLVDVFQVDLFFAVICEELQLLQNLEEYLNLNNAQYFRDMDLWKLREIELKLMLIRSHNYDAAERDLFLRMHKLHQPQQHIILGRYLERRAKELLIQQYALECLAPFMLLFES